MLHIYSQFQIASLLCSCLCSSILLQDHQSSALGWFALEQRCNDCGFESLLVRSLDRESSVPQIKLTLHLGRSPRAALSTWKMFYARFWNYSTTALEVLGDLRLLGCCWRLPMSPLNVSDDTRRCQGGGMYFMNHEQIRKRTEYHCSILPGSIPGCHLYFRREGGEWKYIAS